jgi:NAD(P) transhydrogenase subunit alpha
VKEQVESLGAKFIDVPYETAEEREAAEGVGGYARPMPQSWLDRQKAEVAKRVAQADVVITTALIPGRPAPVLVTEDMVRSMKPGSVIVDLAAGRGPLGPHGQPGGNCPLTQPDQVITAHGVTIIGHTNLPALVAADASALYARNVLDFLKLIVTKEGTLHVNLEDDIVAACRVTHNGQVTRS